MIQQPKIEDRRATFYWNGSQAPMLMGDFTGWEQNPLRLELRGENLWAIELAFEPDAYLEYSFYDGQKRVPDPLNPRTTPDGFGHANHYFYMPHGRPTPLAAGPIGFPAGQISAHLLPCAPFLSGKTRAVHLYRPPAEGPHPLWVVWDGKEYLRRARLCNIVDALIYQKRIRPVALAFVDNGGPARMMEYLCSESTLAFLTESLLPFAADQLDLLDPAEQPGAYGVLGASMGGLMALYTGLRLPHIFGSALSQSGAFAFGERLPLVHDLVERLPRQPLRTWMDVGRYEWLLEPNRRMHALLARQGYEVTYREYHAGHNYPAWRDDIWRGLETLIS